MNQPSRTVFNAKRVIEEEVREVDYDEWLRRAAHGHYDSWLDRKGGSWAGEVTVGLWAENLPDVGFYASEETLDKAVESVVKKVPAYAMSKAPNAAETINRAILAAGATLVVSERKSSRIFAIYSATPVCTMNRVQKEFLLNTFEIHYPEIEWANGLGQPPRPIKIRDFLTGRRSRGASPSHRL